MSGGLDHTFQVLAKTSNEAASSALIAALDSPYPAIQEGSLRALLARRSHAGQCEMLRRWDTFHERWKAIVADEPGSIRGALRDALLSDDERLLVNGCDAVLYLRDYDLVPALINIAEDEANPLAARCAETLLQLAESLYDELASPRDDSCRRDPQVVRQHVLAGLEPSVQRFCRHGPPEIVLSFLILAGRENATLQRILHSPHHRVHLPLLDALKGSPQVGVIHLLLSFLDDPHAPSAAVEILAHRGDKAFVSHLLEKIGEEPTATVRANLKRIETLPWLCDGPSRLDKLKGAEQHAAVQLAAATSLNRLQVFAVIRHVLRQGKPAGRRAAAAALAEFQGFAANSLVLEALGDEDPQVQAAALLQLRPRGIPRALTRLISAVDSPHDEIRQAVQQSLHEFNFQRYLSAFDMLEDDVRRSTGRLVRKVDPHAVEQLRVELASPVRVRRLRALELLPYVEALADVEEQVVGLLTDSDHFVRSEAAGALAGSNTASARQALRQALLDPSVMVRETAERALQHQSSWDSNRQVPPGSSADTQRIAPPIVSKEAFFTQQEAKL